MSYDYFETREQVVAWAAYLVKAGVLAESDFSYAKLRAMAMRVSEKQRNVAYAAAAKLAADYPREYTAWCALQRVTGERK